MAICCDMSWFSACEAESLRARSLKGFRSGSMGLKGVNLHGFAVVHACAVRIGCRRAMVVVLCEKAGILYAVNNSIKAICQTIGFVWSLWVLQLYLNLSLWLQPVNEFVKDLSLRQFWDSRCQNHQN
jgi:hypothetical protein